MISRKHNYYMKRIILIAIALLLLLPIRYFNKNFAKPTIKIDKQSDAINLNKDFYKFFNLGNKRLISGILWVTTLIESDLDHYKGDPLNNWMFYRFDSITDLEPMFLQAYQFGSLYLSVVKDDVPGGSFMFEKGLKLFPNDYQLNYYGGSHFLFEEKDFSRAEELFTNILGHPNAAQFLPSLVAKLRIQKGLDSNEIIEFYKENIKNSPADSPIKKRYELQLYSFIAERDLQCLNKKISHCSRLDYFGNPYIFKNDKWESDRELMKLEITIKEK